MFAVRGVHLADPTPPAVGVDDRRACWPGSPSPTAPTSSSPSASCSAGCCGGIGRAGRRCCSAPSSGSLPMWVHLVMAGPVDAFEGMVIDPVFHLRAGRELPRPPSWGHLDGGLQAVAEEIPPWWKFPHLTASHTLFLWFFLMLVVRRRAARARHLAAPPRRVADRPHRPSLLAVGLVSVGILPQGLQRPDSAHLLWVTCVSFPFLRRRPTIEVVRRWRPRSTLRPRPPRSAPPSPSRVTFVFTSLFTFRYYLLHTRVGLGQVPQAFPVAARRPLLLPRRLPRLPRRAGRRRRARPPRRAR